MGQPFAHEKGKGNPLLAAICGIIFFASFWLLATQMVANRFFGLKLTTHEVVLSMADGSSLSVKRAEIRRFGFQSEMNARYVVISTQGGEFYRGGPCVQDCERMAESIDAWMRASSSNAER